MFVIDDRQGGQGSEKYNAGSKARSDVDEILANNYNDVLFVYKRGKSKFSSSIHFLLKQFINKDVFLVQYPLYINDIIRKLFYMLSKNKRKVCLIHDLSSLRFSPDDQGKIRKEIEELNQYDILIVHNQSMQNWLESQGINKKMIQLGIFDYLVSSTDYSNNNGKYDLVVAGNLSKEKSSYIYKMIENNGDVSFQLFGVNFDPDSLNCNNYSYEGSKKPDELPSYINAKYGLVWDGNEIDYCDGNFGNYLKYNNPHKLSLYLASGIPVIVWTSSAMATYVLKNEVGIVVSSLNDLSSCINTIDKRKYECMKNNALMLSKQLIKGENLLESVKDI